jgi:predicted esterase
MREVRISYFPFLHGALDPVVPLKEDQEMVDALRAFGGDVKFSFYPDAGHDAWTRACEGPALYDWLLVHRRAAR